MTYQQNSRFTRCFGQFSNKLMKHCLTTACEVFSIALASPQKTVSFKKYFEWEWAPRKEQWAYCFRVGLGINTNEFVEAFHKAFKYQYLKGRTNKCLDDCLLNLLKYVRDKTFDCLIKLTKGKVTKHINIIQERHLRSLTLSTGSVKAEDPNTWTVLGEDGRSSYKVSKLLDACNKQQNCQLKCQECNICVHICLCVIAPTA